MVFSNSQYKAVTTSRRAGKTILLTASATDALITTKPDEVVIYLAKTRSAAKELFWTKLHNINSKFNLGIEFNESTLSARSPTGGVLLVRAAEGSNPKDEREKLRGLKLKRALLDEPATYSGTLKILLRDVIEPALGDLSGDVIISGTPGLTPVGAWYDISTGRLPKWKTFHWTIRDNPHFPNAEAYLAKVLKDNNWDITNPTYQREYEGRWSTDSSVTVYSYTSSHNLVETIPEYSKDWIHTIGVDFGLVDSSAWTVLATNKNRNDTYVVRSFKIPNLLPDEAAEVTQKLVEEYNPFTLVGDGGGLGKPYIEAFNRRYRANMLCSDKTEKLAHIRLINGDFKSGKLKLLRSQTEDLITELEQLPWSDETKTREHPSYDNHCCDSLLYSWRHHRAYLHEPAIIKNTDSAYNEDFQIEKEIAQLKRNWWDV